MPEVPELLRKAGWRQGSLAGSADQLALLNASVDRIPEPGDVPFRLVIVTQDCDLVADPGLEPFVEFIFGSESDPVDPLYRHGRNPRLLHLGTVGDHGPGPSLLFSIQDRFRIPKEALHAAAAERDLRLEQQDTNLLRKWIAKRYTRAAFPDAFNARLSAVDRRLESLFKSTEGQIITGVFLDVPDEEFDDEKPYKIAVRISVPGDAWGREDSRAALNRFEERFLSIFADCEGILLVDGDMDTRPETHLTLEDLRTYRRLDRDYRSLSERGGVMSPADGGGEL